MDGSEVVEPHLLIKLIKHDLHSPVSSQVIAYKSTSITYNQSLQTVPQYAISNPGGISSLQTLPAFNWLGSSTNGRCGSPAAKAWQVSRHTPTLVLSLTLSMMPLSSEKLPPTVVPWPHIFSSTEFREEMPPSLWHTRHVNIWYLTAEARPGIVGAAAFPRQKVASGMWGMSEDSSGVIWITNHCGKVSQLHTYSYSMYWYEIMVFYWNLLLERLQIRGHQHTRWTSWKLWNQKRNHGPRLPTEQSRSTQTHIFTAV